MELINNYPWLTIWIHPRKTMKYLFFKGINNRIVFVLIFLSAFIESIRTSDMSSIGNILLFIVLIFIGSFIALFILSISTDLLEWTGSWIKGQGNTEEIKIALAWSNIPIIGTAFLGTGLSILQDLKLAPIYSEVFSWFE